MTTIVSQMQLKAHLLVEGITQLRTPSPGWPPTLRNRITVCLAGISPTMRTCTSRTTSCSPTVLSSSSDTIPRRRT